MKIKKGQIVAITTGDFSYYSVNDHLRALRDFDAYEEAERFKREGDYLVPYKYDPNGTPNHSGSTGRFLAWAIREGLMEPTHDEVVELWIGSSDSLEVYE